MLNSADLPTVSVAELPEDAGVLLDVREADEWASGHAPRAVHIPLGDLPTRLDELAELPEDSPLYVVCRSGGRSARAVEYLNVNGYEATNVAGGMKSWHTEGRPLVGDFEGVDPEVL